MVCKVSDDVYIQFNCHLYGPSKLHNAQQIMNISSNTWINVIGTSYLSILNDLILLMTCSTLMCLLAISLVFMTSFLGI